MPRIWSVVPAFAVSLLVSACASQSPADDKASIRSLLPPAADIAADAERRGDWEIAARQWRAAYEAAPGDRTVALSLARSLRLSGSCGPAAGVVGDLLTRNPSDTDALLESAKCQLVSGRPEAAEQQLRAVIQGAPESWEAETTLAVVLDRVGRHVEAQAHHDRALELVPEKPIVLSNKALSLALSGRLPEALTLMRKAASMPASPMRVRMNLAMLEAVSGHGDRAVTIASQESMADKTENLQLLKKIAEASAGKGTAR